MFTTLLVQPLFNILFAIYGLLPGHDFGVAVIILTILVRLLLWPLVTKQLHSQKAMQQLAPEIAKIREQTKGDRQKETEMLMELYKKRGTSPFAPMLPLLIQLPIFFALYIVFRDAIHPDKIAELTYGFVSQIPAVANVIAHHSAFDPTLFGLIDLTKPSPILALTAAAAQWYQVKMMQPKKDSSVKVDDATRIAQSMSLVFPVLTFFIGLTLPSALALYWTVTSLVAAYQQYLVLMRDAREMEEGPIVVSEKSSAVNPGSASSTTVKSEGPAAVSSDSNPKSKSKAKGKGRRKATKRRA
jgi:YidC/Oxa1 family membrane protein insertase